jgi:hypothetical protein
VAAVTDDDCPTRGHRRGRPNLLGLGMLGLTFGVIRGSIDGWMALPITSLVAGAAAIATFSARQRLATNPVVLPSLLANRGFTFGLLLGLGNFAANNGSPTSSPSVRVACSTRRSSGRGH